MEYIKGGDILIAPCLDYKYQYLLKCSECDACYRRLEPFLAHCTSHYERGVLEVAHHNAFIRNDLCYEPNEILEDSNDMTVELNRLNAPTVEDSLDNFDNVECGREEIKVELDKSLLPLKTEEIYDNSDNDCIEELECEKEESTEENPFENIEHENKFTNGKIFEDTQMQKCNKNNLKRTLLALDTKEVDENSMEDSQLSNDEHSNTTTLHINEFLKTFLAKNENILALIDAYKSQPKLWNYNTLSQFRRSSLRSKYLHKIIKELAEKINLDISIHQLVSAIMHLRHVYRTKLERDRTGNECNKIEDDWICGLLSFLKPYMDNTYIDILDSHSEDLTPVQIEQLICIYKCYTHLWNTDLMEYCCKNKRAVALKQMAKTLETEMDLEVDENALEIYLQCLHNHFSREKRHEMGLSKSNEPKSEYYDSLRFLYHHEGPFKCPTCNREFKDSLPFKIHKYHHSGKNSLKCPRCKKGFAKADTYISHVRRHMNDFAVECNECDKKFVRSTDLRIHMRYHTGIKPYCCDVCGASFRHSQAFKIHNRRHDKQYTHKCSVCSKGCYTKQELNIHLKSHIDTRDCECPICGKTFKIKKTLRQHMFIHEEGRKHVCTLCGKKFKNKIGLGQHIKLHRRKDTSTNDVASIFLSKSV